MPIKRFIRCCHLTGRWAGRHARVLVAALLLVLILLAATARLLFPSLEDYRPEVESWLSEVLHTPVSVGSLGADWHGWVPELRLEQVHLLDAGGGTALTLSSLLVRVDVIRSIRTASIHPSRLAVHGLGLTLIRTSGGQVTICCAGGEHASVSGKSNGASILGWLVGQGHLEFVDSRITWHDQGRGLPPLRLEGVKLRLGQAGNKRRVIGDALLPPGVGDRLHVELNLLSPVGKPWLGQAYLQIQGLRLESPWLQAWQPENLAVGSGQADVQLWGHLENGSVDTVTGRLLAQDLTLAYRGQVVPLLDLGGDLDYRIMEGGRSLLRIKGNLVRTGGREWKGVDMEGFAVFEEGKAVRYGGNINRIPLDEARPYAGLLLADAPALTDWLGVTHPEGILEELEFIRTTDPEGIAHLQLNSGFRGVKLQAAGRIPGVQALDGRFRMTEKDGQVELDSHSVMGDLPRLFQHPLFLDSLTGNIRWRRNQQGWLVESDGLHLANPDIRVDLASRIELDDSGDSPRVFLIGDLSDGDGSSTPSYLPVHIMGDRLVEWLSHSIVGARVTSGGFLLHGRLSDFPFDDGTGRFEVRATVEQGILDYLPGWPRLEEIQAELVFHERSMDITATSARVLEAHVGTTRVSMQDMTAHPRHLKIQGRVTGSGADGLRLLRETPLKERFRGYLDDARISGHVQVGLDMDLPLDPVPSLVAGEVIFSGNRLTSDRLGVDLSGVSGALGFSNQGLQADNITARLFDRPVTLTVSSEVRKGQAINRIQVRGVFEDKYLKKYLAGPTHSDTTDRLKNLLQRLQGKTSWQADLEIPAFQGKRPPPPRLRITSDLVGFSLELPQPIGKTAKEPRNLRITTTLDDAAQRLVTFAYGDHLQGTLEFLAHQGGLKFQRGGIYLDEPDEGLPNRSGLHVGGRIEEFSTTRWLSILAPEAGSKPGPRSGGGPVGKTESPVRDIEVVAEQFEIVGQWMRNVRIHANRRDDGGWLVLVDAPIVSGGLSVPPEGSLEPISMDFKRLSFNTGSARQTSNKLQNPEDIPPLHFKCDKLTINDVELGRITLKTLPEPDGLRIEELRVQGREFDASVTGNWQETGEQQVSRFKIELHSPNLGTMLKAMGYEEVALKGGETRMKIDAVWRGAPTDFSLEQMNGYLELKIANGRLLDVNPGPAGRAFGLVSLAALPRRLKLDFSDLFKKGLAYDRIEGSFTIDNGDAYTNDLYMESPAARIDVAGRVGLASRDYDQLVTVTPEVSSTLPIAGAIAGGPIGAAVGAAAAIIAEKVFKSEMRQVIRRQYLVTGGWDNPSVERLKDGEGEEGLEDGPNPAQ